MASGDRGRFDEGMKSHMSKSEHILRKASAPSLKARARVQPLRVCLLRATHSHAHAHVHVHGHVRAHTWAYLQWVSVAGGVGGLLLRRPMIEQGAVSTCVRALMCWVRDVRAPRGGSRRTRIAPARRRGSCARPADSEDATLGEAPAPLAHGPVRRAPALAARSLKHASEAAAHMPARAHARRHDASTSC